MDKTTFLTSLFVHLKEARYLGHQRPLVPIRDEYFMPLKDALDQYLRYRQALQRGECLSASDKLKYQQFFPRTHSTPYKLDFGKAAAFISTVTRCSKAEAATAVYLCFTYHHLHASKDNGSAAAIPLTLQKLFEQYIQYLSTFSGSEPDLLFCVLPDTFETGSLASLQSLGERNKAMFLRTLVFLGDKGTDSRPIRGKTLKRTLQSV